MVALLQNKRVKCNKGHSQKEKKKKTTKKEARHNLQQLSAPSVLRNKSLMRTAQHSDRHREFGIANALKC